MIGASIRAAVEQEISDYDSSRLKTIVDLSGGERLAIKFVASRWASAYGTPRPLKISETPALTWGTATYVTPIAYSLSSVLYGRVGLVSDFDPTGWKVFDATTTHARLAYIRWVQAQPIFDDLVLTVHSTFANHKLRNKFRRDFAIDCVLFHPDQEAELHTDMSAHLWMAVTDWLPQRRLGTTFSSRLANARFTVLVDEEFDLAESGGLPIKVAKRKIETTTTTFPTRRCQPVSLARANPALWSDIASLYRSNGYLHVFVEP